MTLACRQGRPALLVPSLHMPDPDSLVEGAHGVCKSMTARL
jgi:hypothetical protein